MKQLILCGLISGVTTTLTGSFLIGLLVGVILVIIFASINPKHLQNMGIK